MGRGPNKPGSRFTQERKQRYVAALRRTGLKTVAHRVVDVSRATVWRHRQRYREFARAEENGLVAYRHAIGDEINRHTVAVLQRGERTRRHIPPGLKVDQHERPWAFTGGARSRRVLARRWSYCLSVAWLVEFQDLGRRWFRCCPRPFPTRGAAIDWVNDCRERWRPHHYRLRIRLVDASRTMSRR